MNGEQLLNVLGYLDNDLIEETGKIRGRKRKPYWLMATLAACLCFVLLTGINPTMKAPESAMNNGISDMLKDDVKMEAEAESPMESVRIQTSVLRVTEVAEDYFSGIVQHEASDVECLTIYCDQGISNQLKVGDVVEVTYIAENRNDLLDIDIITE